MATRFHGWEHNEATSDLVTTAAEWGTVYLALTQAAGGALYPVALKQGGLGNFVSGGRVFTITRTR